MCVVVVVVVFDVFIIDTSKISVVKCSFGLSVSICLFNNAI